MRRYGTALKSRLAMYSKIPMPRADWEKENMRYMMCFFPLIGAVIGALLIGWEWLALRLQAGDILRSAGLCADSRGGDGRHSTWTAFGIRRTPCPPTSPGAEAGDPEGFQRRGLRGHHGLLLFSGVFRDFQRA